MQPATAQTDPTDGCPPALRCDDLEPDATPLAVLESVMTATLDDLRAEARQAAEQARAANTARAYAADWRDFSAFCARIGREHLPAEPETITLYLADLMHRGRAAATWARRLSAIAVYHRPAGFSSSPTARGPRDVGGAGREDRGVDHAARSLAERRGGAALHPGRAAQGR